MELIQQKVINLSLNKMFTSSYFSICTIDKCLKLSGIIPEKLTYDTMSTLHCVEYKEMPEEVRQWLINSVKEMFEYDNSFDLSFTKETIKQTDIIYAGIISPERKDMKLSLMQRILKLKS